MLGHTPGHGVAALGARAGHAVRHRRIGVSAYRRIGLWACRACRATESATHLQACVFPNRLPVSLMPHSSSTNAGLFSSGSPPSNSQ